MRFDLVLDNASVITCDPARPRAGSIGILGDRIVAVAGAGELAPWEAGHRIDLAGAAVVPGFVLATMVGGTFAHDAAELG